MAKLVPVRGYGGGEGFDLLMENCIMDSMKGALGQSGADSIVYHLHLKKFGNDLGAFHSGLASLLGDPAVVIETLIIKSLYSRLGLQFDEGENLDFVRRANYAKVTFSSRPAERAGER